MSYEIHPAQAAAQERRPPPLWPALASLKIPAWKRGATATHKSLGVKWILNILGRILRSKVSLIGWAHGEGERTSLRKVDHGEDDPAMLCADFARLRRVSAHLYLVKPNF